ncbi:MAG: acylphosphatase [Nanoarchaeota archaeon]
MKRRIHIFIYGKVLGVFFRSFIRDNATALSLKGTVRNLEDCVEAVFEGSSDQINRMIELCRKGPKFAKVSDIRIIEEDFKNEYKEFSIAH